jgi:hypothetical protein
MQAVGAEEETPLVVAEQAVGAMVAFQLMVLLAQLTRVVAVEVAGQTQEQHIQEVLEGLE